MFYRTLLLCLATLGSFAQYRGHAEEPKEKEPKEPEVVLSSKVATDGGFLTLPVKVGEQWRTFMVDTGTSLTTLDAPLVEDLPKADEAMRVMRATHVGQVIPDLYAPPKMIVRGTTGGEVEFPAECAVMPYDLAPARAASKQPIEGILGMDFLSRYAIELDLAAGTLRLLNSQRLPPGAKHDATLHIHMIHLKPILPVRAAGDVQSLALLDTGALGTLYAERKRYDRLVDNGQVMRWLLDEKEVDGEKQRLYAHAGWLHDLKVGPFTHYCLVVYPGHKDRPFSVLGLYYWRRYRCIFDFPKSQVYLDKGPLFDVFDDSDQAGIILTKKENRLLVDGVHMRGWAKHEGVRVGDQIIQIDGEGVESDTEQTISNRLSFHHDRTCELRLIRDGKELTIVLPATGSQPKPVDDSVNSRLKKED